MTQHPIDSSVGGSLTTRKVDDIENRFKEAVMNDQNPFENLEADDVLFLIRTVRELDTFQRHAVKTVVKYIDQAEGFKNELMKLEETMPEHPSQFWK